MAASYNQAGQLTSESRSRPDGVTSVGYRYNNAGQRTQQASTGPDGASVLSYAYTAAGRMASTTQDGATTTFGYDGLGRNLTSATDGVGATNVWAGMAVVQQHNDNTGTATLVRDALGQVALQSTAPGDISAAPAWSLHDRLGSTVAQTTPNGRITDLASYSDFGVPKFASAGFASTTGFTGELSDATTGTNAYFSRTYDPMAATWLSPDSYRGTLTNPQSQHRYGYVGGNPATFSDAFGFAAHSVFDGSRRPPPPSAYIHTADGWDRASAANPGARTPIDSGTTHVTPRHGDFWDSVGNAFARSIQSQVDLNLNIVGGLVDGVMGLVGALWDIQPIAMVIKTFINPNWYAEETAAKQAAIQGLLSSPDPGGATLHAVGNALVGFDEWGTNPGHAVGTTLFSLATLVAPGGALVKGLKAEEVLTTSANIEARLEATAVNKVDGAVGAFCSFAGATLVLMADGTSKPIEDIQVGDQVLAADPETGEQAAKKVTHLWVHEDELIDLQTSAGTVTTTENHPFWDVTDRKWEAAEDLHPGDKLLTADGSTITVDGLNPGTTERGAAYNLTVDDLHTYYVRAGDGSALVHNTGCKPASLTPDGAGRPGAFNQAKQDAGIPTSMSPTRTLPNVDARGYSQPGYSYEFDLPSGGGSKGTVTVIIRDDAGGHVFPDDPTQNRGPHFNGPGGEHYDY